MNPVFEGELPDVPFELNLKGFYILLINVNQGPPHLAIVFANTYYSVTVNSVSRGLDFKPKFQSLLRKNLPLLFIEIEQNPNRDEIFTKLNQVFYEISPLSGDGVTCLAPIKRSLELVYSLNIKANLVAELLHQLQKLKLIKAISSPTLNSGSFQLHPYNMQDVARHIKSLLK